MRVGDDEDDDDTAALPQWLGRYEKVEKLPRIFVASVVVSKYIPRQRLLQIEKKNGEIENQTTVLPCPQCFSLCMISYPHMYLKQLRGRDRRRDRRRPYCIAEKHRVAWLVIPIIIIGIHIHTFLPSPIHLTL